jgi:hypothetical protein
VHRPDQVVFGGLPGQAAPPNDPCAVADRSPDLLVSFCLTNDFSKQLKNHLAANALYSSRFREVPVREAIKLFPEYFVVALVCFTIVF